MPVAAKRVCPNCKLWEIRDDDAYCGWCSHPVGRLQVKVDPGSYFRIGEISPLTSLQIQNTTCGAVKISSIRVIRGDWVKVEEMDWNETDALQPYRILEQPLEINTLDLISDFV